MYLKGAGNSSPLWFWKYMILTSFQSFFWQGGGRRGGGCWTWITVNMVEVSIPPVICSSQRLHSFWQLPSLDKPAVRNAGCFWRLAFCSPSVITEGGHVNYDSTPALFILYYRQSILDRAMYTYHTMSAHVRWFSGLLCVAILFMYST